MSSFELSTSTEICYYPRMLPSFANTFPLGNLDKIFSVFGKWWWRLVASFKSKCSRQILNLPFSLFAIAIELPHSEDPEIGTSSIMSRRFILSSLFLNLSFNAVGTRCGAWMTLRHWIWVGFYIAFLLTLSLQNNWHTHYKSQYHY